MNIHLLVSSSFVSHSRYSTNEILEGEFENEFPPTVIHYYLAFRAFDRFLSKYNRPPSSADHETLVSLVTEVLTAPPANEQLVSDACAEMYLSLLLRWS